MSVPYHPHEVYITEDEVREMLEGIGWAIEELTATCDRKHEPIIAALRRSREIGGQIWTDVVGEDDE